MYLYCIFTLESMLLHNVMYPTYQRPAFASHSSSSSDVNKFFEDCKYPPMLDLFSSEDGLDVQEALVSCVFY